MKEQAEIEAKLFEIIQDVSLGRITADSIQPNSKIMSDLNLDSLDYAQIMLGCEEWMNIKIIEASINWREIQTVGDLAGLFHKMQK